MRIASVRRFTFFGTLAAVMFCGAVALRADDLADQIAPHKIGETLNEWLRLNNMEVDAICKGPKMNKVVCKSIRGFAAGKPGFFYTKNQHGATVGWQFSNGVIAGATISGALGGQLPEPRITEDQAENEFSPRTGLVFRLA